MRKVESQVEQWPERVAQYKAAEKSPPTRAEMAELLRKELARPGAVSWLDKNEFGNWRGRCGAPGCGWVDQRPANCPVHDDPRCWHAESDRPMVPQWYPTDKAATASLNQHLAEEHGLL